MVLWASLAESMFCIQHECTLHNWVHPLLSAFWVMGCLTCGPYVLPSPKECDSIWVYCPSQVLLDECIWACSEVHGNTVAMSMYMYMASYTAVAVEQGVGVASPVCGTLRLLKEVASPLDRSVLCSQVAVRCQLQDPAHREPKEMDGLTLWSAKVMSFACHIRGRTSTVWYPSGWRWHPISNAPTRNHLRHDSRWVRRHSWWCYSTASFSDKFWSHQSLLCSGCHAWHPTALPTPCSSGSQTLRQFCQSLNRGRFLIGGGSVTVLLWQCVSGTVRMCYTSF